jgi:hypothetical protein
MSLFHRRRTDTVPADVAPPDVKPPTAAAARQGRRPHAGLLRRERRELVAARDQKLQELGGLLVEMYRRGAFRDDLLQERCAQLVGIDTRLTEIEDLLHGRAGTRICTCGAPIPFGAHFCANCGRVVDGVARGAAAGDDTVIVQPRERG